MKIKLLGLLSVLLIIVGVWMMKRSNFEKKWDQQMQNMQSYILEGKMELKKGQEYQKYEIEVYYQKDGDCYKVVLNDPTLKQSQSIVRNEDGVFVMTPQLNQIFHFQGSWPNNTKKPYLIQTMNEILQEAKIQQQKNKMIAEGEIHDPSHPQYKYQKMIFDQEARVEEIMIYNENKEIEVKMIFERCDWNPKLEKDTFTIPEKLDVKTSAFPQEQLPLYPMEVFGSKLNDISYVETIEGEKIMMTYEGEKSFTLIQSVRTPSEQTQAVFMPGTLHDDYDLFGSEELFQFSAFHRGIEFHIYSQDLTTLEMIEILNSMQGVGMK